MVKRPPTYLEACREHFCECGCGEQTNKRFIKNHNFRVQKFSFPGASHPQWKGGRIVRSHGYICVLEPNHPKAVGGYVYEHVLLAERILKRPLPQNAEVHHINAIKSDNRPSNLVICENRAYHILLHQRSRALKASGHPTWKKCGFCKRWDNPRNMQGVWNRPSVAYHASCNREALAQRRWPERKKRPSTYQETIRENDGRPSCRECGRPMEYRGPHAMCRGCERDLAKLQQLTAPQLVRKDLLCRQMQQNSSRSETPNQTETSST